MNITGLQPNTKTINDKKINDKKINDIKKVLHLISERSFYTYDFKKYMNKLVMTLKPSQWIAFNKFAYNNTFFNNYQTSDIYRKPQGMYCSKGEWFFHEKHIENETNLHELQNHYVNFIDVDYTNIMVITNIHQAKKFLKKYVDIFPYPDPDPTYIGSYYIDWNAVRQKYWGFVLIPNFSFFSQNKNDKHALEHIKNGHLLYGYDVSTLVFWDNRCVKNYKTLFNVSKYINEKNYTTYENKKKSTKLLINNIIKEIS